MNEAAKSQRSKVEKIVLVAVIIVASLGVAYMAYDYVTTMEQLDNLSKGMTENSSLTDDSNIDSDLGDVDTWQVKKIVRIEWQLTVRYANTAVDLSVISASRIIWHAMIQTMIRRYGGRIWDKMILTSLINHEYENT